MTFCKTFCKTFSVTFSVTFGVTFGVTFRKTFSMTFGKTFGMTFRKTFSMGLLFDRLLQSPHVSPVLKMLLISPLCPSKQIHHFYLIHRFHNSLIVAPHFIQLSSVFHTQQPDPRLAYWDKRSLFYLAKMYTDGVFSGQSYDRLKKCIVISILDFDLDPFPDYHKVYYLQDQRGRQYS